MVVLATGFIGMFYLGSDDGSSLLPENVAAPASTEGRSLSEQGAGAEQTFGLETYVESQVASQAELDPYFSVEYPYDYLTYPNLPGDVYTRHLVPALGGDADSMFWVSQAYWECRNAPRDEDDFLSMIESEARFAYAQDVFERLLRRCESLFQAQADEVSMFDEAKAWLDRAAVAGHNTARARALIEQFPTAIVSGDAMNEELVHLLIEAARTDGYPAYYQIERYITFQTRAELAINGGADYSQQPDPVWSVREISWHYAACKLHSGCNASALLSRIEAHLYPHQQAEMYELVALIESGKFDQAIDYSG